MEETKKQKLRTKGSVTIGIFNAIIYVISFLTGTITGLTPAGNVFFPALYAFVAAPVFMVLIAKVHKKGTFLLTGAIQGLIWTITGGFIMLVANLVSCVICELILNKSQYKNIRKIYLAYGIHMLGVFLAALGPMFFFADWYLNSAVRMGFDQTYMEQVIQSAMGPVGLLAFAVMFIACVLGCIFGRRIFNKHFVSAGIL